MSEFTSNDHKFMMLAIDEAKKAVSLAEVPVGAVIVSPQGEVVGQACNMVIALNEATAHAEVLAIREASKNIGNYRLLGHTLYSTLEPCPMCMMAAIHARLKRVVYGAVEPKWGAAGSLIDLAALDGLNHCLEVEGGLMADEASHLIIDFFKKKREALKYLPKQA